MTLKEQLAQAIVDARQALEAGDTEKGKALRQKAEGLKTALDELDAINGLSEMTKAGSLMRPGLPGVGSGDASLPQVQAGNKGTDAVYVLRFGNEDEAIKAIYHDLLGADYRQLIVDQAMAYAKYLRAGERDLDARDRKALRTQIFPQATVKAMVAGGLDVSGIKSTMVEAEGTLGGYAVPPAQQAEIAARLPGLTAVRAGGARVVDLISGSSVDAPVYDGGDARYVGALRGQWGNETAAPTAKNATMKSVTVVANLYTYKVPMSQTLVEDAANLVQIVTDDIVGTLAIDEDEAFLVGDGVGKPYGILPGGVNALGLAEVKTGAASALTAAGIKGLKRGVASQYRANGVFVANSDTYGEAELLTNGLGQYIFEDLSETGQLLMRKAVESEAMPDVGSNTYPLVFGDMTGYWIVQKAGLAIVRFQDSATGINQVEYHVRRRVGGRVVQTWKFAVQKVAA